MNLPPDYVRKRRNLLRRKPGARIVVLVSPTQYKPVQERVATFHGFASEDPYHHLTDRQFVAVMVDGEKTLRILHFSYVLRSAPRRVS